MAIPRDVARYLIRLASTDPESEGLTQMRLHKLMYYAQGWSLVFSDRPLFDSPIEAWKHGPVVKEIYRLYKDHGNQPIPDDQQAIDLSDEEQRLIQSVWLGYRRFSAAGLRRKSHREPPWINARQGCEMDERSAQPIRTEDLQRFFRAEYSRQKLPGLSRKSLQLAEVEFHSGKGIPLSDVVPGE